jgi:hypothetical protein
LGDLILGESATLERVDDMVELVATGKAAGVPDLWSSADFPVVLTHHGRVEQALSPGPSFIRRTVERSVCAKTDVIYAD